MKTKYSSFEEMYNAKMPETPSGACDPSWDCDHWQSEYCKTKCAHRPTLKDDLDFSITDVEVAYNED